MFLIFCNSLSFIGNISGQNINKAKSNLFVGKGAEKRSNSLENISGIKIGRLPFTYLGVPICKGIPRKKSLQPISDEVRSKLNGWTGKFLSCSR